MSDGIDWLHSHRGMCKVDLYSPTGQQDQDRKVVRDKMTPTKEWKGLAFGYRYPRAQDRLMESHSVTSPSHQDQRGLWGTSVLIHHTQGQFKGGAR